MKYNIIMLHQQPTGSVHCSTVKDKGRVLTYASKHIAEWDIAKLKVSAPDATFIVSRHWR